MVSCKLVNENFAKRGHRLLPLEQRFFLTDFSRWVNYLLLAFPPKLRSTFLELFLGTLIASSGHVTDPCLPLCGAT
jgi:hypothetical protein